MKSVAFSVIILLAGVSFGQDKDKDKEKDKPKLTEETSYFPLKEGSTWTYKVQGKTVVTKLVGFEKIGEDVCAKLETREDKKLLATEWLTVRTDGVYRCKFADQQVSPPIAILKLPVKTGNTWEIKSKVGPQEVTGRFTIGEMKGLKVGEKTYDTVTVTSKDLKMDNLNVDTTYYFAEKVGIVKQTVEIGGTKIELELEKYEEGKN